jgi:hypothetical protein
MGEYLMDTMMNKACELMDNGFTDHRGHRRSVGYTDPLLFYKMFKRAKENPKRIQKVLFMSKYAVALKGWVGNHIITVMHYSDTLCWIYVM